ncbi:hypothetical protein [Kitasatospora cathayae]|uniref:Integrase n=1 Tax=Kitasatospora cathayae TaxID=3004092 RepID=A0ABY7QEJ2_9ACTN|nr:hypothetical protein [Kitasatospora sp. HUAS 3-15]WBP91115.1 hypothetical protein O1G21_38065 [Kitasatospora sp. HUAS 3-15]
MAEPDVAATVGVLRHLIERYVHRVRSTMLSEEDGAAPPAGGAADGDGCAVRDAVEP